MDCKNEYTIYLIIFISRRAKKRILNFYLMKTKMKVCQVGHFNGPVPQAKGQ